MIHALTMKQESAPSSADVEYDDSISRFGLDRFCHGPGFGV